MIKYVGYDRYFDYDSILMVLNPPSKDVSKIKKDLKAYVPYVVGKHRRLWFKEDDLIKYVGTSFFERFKDHGIIDDIFRYTTEEKLFSILGNAYTEYGKICKKIAVQKPDQKTKEKMNALYAKIGTIERILLLSEYYPRSHIKDRGIMYDLLKEYRDKAIKEGLFDNETTDLLKE